MPTTTPPHFTHSTNLIEYSGDDPILYRVTCTCGRSRWHLDWIAANVDMLAHEDATNA